MERIGEDGKVIGQTRGAKAYKRWVPKEWRPEYEAIVALSCTGLHNEEVGRRFGYGKQQVSNILNTPQAKKLREIITTRLREKNNETFGERLSKLNEAALSHVETLLENPEYFNKSPLAIFDRSVTVLKSTGVMKSPETMNNNGAHIGTFIGKQMIMTSEAANILSEGLRKANEVQVIHSGDTKLIKP